MGVVEEEKALARKIIGITILSVKFTPKNATKYHVTYKHVLNWLHLQTRKFYMKPKMSCWIQATMQEHTILMYSMLYVFNASIFPYLGVFLINLAYFQQHAKY